MRIKISLDTIEVCSYTPKFDETVVREVAKGGEILVVVVLFIVLYVVERDKNRYRCHVTLIKVLL